MKRSILLLTLLAAGSAQAWDCKHEKDIDTTLDLAGSDQLSVRAMAGDLEITGKPGISEARVRGRVCASKEEWADAAEIVTESGREADITVSLPDTDGWSLWGDRYVYMDLQIEVPDDLPLDVRDSSGDIEIADTGAVALQDSSGNIKIRNTGPLSLSDSSGDIDIEGVHGALVLEDSSGDIDLERIEGDVTVNQDSSGDMYGRDIGGSVLVKKDSSGEIRFRDVHSDFVVERDSSGDIVADTIGGDFRVLKDSSGDIRSSDVEGSVEIPSQG